MPGRWRCECQNLRLASAKHRACHRRRGRRVGEVRLSLRVSVTADDGCPAGWMQRSHVGRHPNARSRISARVSGRLAPYRSALGSVAVDDGRVEDWRADVRLRWVSHNFRSGPQSGCHHHVSSPAASNVACDLLVLRSPVLCSTRMASPSLRNRRRQTAAAPLFTEDGEQSSRRHIWARAMREAAKKVNETAKGAARIRRASSLCVSARPDQ